MSDYWPDPLPPTNVHFDLHDISILSVVEKKQTKKLLGGMTEDSYFFFCYSGM